MWPRRNSPPNDSSPYDAEAERELLRIWRNQARAQAGLPPLQMDDGLTQAARAHAAAMAAQQQLSHQFAREPSLAERLAANCTLHLDRAGENVSVASSVELSHQGLMHSPPIGRAVESWLQCGWIRRRRVGKPLYVAQDFAHSLRLILRGKLEAWSAEALPACGGRITCPAAVDG